LQCLDFLGFRIWHHFRGCLALHTLSDYLACSNLLVYSETIVKLTT